MENQELLINIENSIATLTINRPKYGNALSKDNYRAIMEAMKSFEDNEEVRVIIITSTGDNFSAGGDVTQFKVAIETKTHIPYDTVRETGYMIEAIIKNKKPVIAAVEGFAVGAGFGLAMACDFIVVGERSRLIPGFSNMGLPGDTGLIYRLYRAIGSFRTRRHLMLNETINASLAKEYGLAYDVVPDQTVYATALKLAHKLAQGPYIAYAYQKEMMATIEYPALDEFNQLEAKYMHEASKQANHFEAVEAFLNKRQPNF